MYRTDPSSLVDPKFLGVPYKLGKEGFDECDCIGICILWLNEQGFNYKYSDGQGKVMAKWWESKPWRFRDALMKFGDIITFKQVKKYDCLLFFMDETANKYPSCMGVMVDDRHFLISLEKIGSAVYMLNKTWRARYFSAVRLHQVTQRK